MKRTLATLWIFFVLTVIIGVVVNAVVYVVTAASHGDQFAQFFCFLVGGVCAVAITGWAASEVWG